jgi:hypothetical protein
MPRTADGALAALTPVRPPLTLINLGREEINPDAMDNVIMRLFRELNRQLVLLEETKPENIKETSDHERRARILASLERTMERLTTLEAGRAATRKSQANVKDDSARTMLLRKLTILIEAKEVEERGGEADEG